MRHHRVVLIAIALIAALTTVPAPAQQNGAALPSAQPSAVSDSDIQLLRENIRSSRKKITAANMNLTADEATKFWPIFDQYQQELNKIGDERWQMMKAYAAIYPNVTAAQAQDFMQRSTAIDQQMIALRERYVPIFEKVVSPKKAALWYQIDRQIDLLVNLQLASMLPLVDPTK
jgi:Spy/CpxP family protein refolding chaperone